MRLDLGKRGVRGLTRIRDRYVIAAGPHGDERYVDGATDYKLFSWNGQPQDAPVLIEAPIDGLTLEALAPAPDGASLLLVSDDGRAQLGSGLID
jgi:hypothetical protein